MLEVTSLHLLRELALTFIMALLAAFVLPWPVTTDPYSRFIGTLIMVLPFQAGYAVASLAGKRAPPWLLLVLAAAVLGLTVPAMMNEPLPGQWGGIPLGAAVLAAGLALALLAALRVKGGRLRAAAGALWLFAAGFPGTRALLIPLVPAISAAEAAAVLTSVGGTYTLLRLVWAIVQPMPVDPWFRRP